MIPLDRLPIVRTLRARGLLVPAAVAVAVAGVLVHGALTRELPTETIDAVVEMGPPSVPPPAGFRPDLEKTPLTYESDYWHQIGHRAAENLVLIGTQPTPGVLLAPGLALTSIDAALDVERADRIRRAEADEAAPGGTAGGANGGAATEGFPPAPRLVGVDVGAHVALFAVPDPTPSAFEAIDAAALQEGTFIAAVTLGADGSLGLTPGHLVSASSGASPDRPFEVSMAFPSSTTVAALIDLDGRLIGLALRQGDGMRLMTARSALAVAARLHAGQSCRALEVGDLDDTARRLLGAAGGVAVEFVLESAFAAPPPIRAGDILVEWNGESVGGAEEFTALYDGAEAGARVAVRVLRGRRPVSGALRMPLDDCRPAPEPLARFAALGMTAEWTHAPAAWNVLVVRADSPAAAAGLEPGDLVVAVDGRPLDPASPRAPFDRFERRPRATVLTVRRQARTKLLTLVPSHD